MRHILRILGSADLPAQAGLCTFSDMKPGRDIAVTFQGLFVVHHNRPGSKVARHSHSEHHLIIPLRGESRLETDAGEWSFGPGKMAYLPSGLEHEFLATNQKEGERLIAMLDNSLWKKVQGPSLGARLLPTQQLCKELLFQLVIAPKIPAAREIVVCFASVLATALQQSEELGSEAAIEQILSKAEDARVEKVVKHLRAHFREDIKISELAKISGLSERNLSRLFLQELGMSPKQALTRLRLEKAREILRGRKTSVTEACFEVGYGSLSRFIQSYRASFGKLPSEE